MVYFGMYSFQKNPGNEWCNGGVLGGAKRPGSVDQMNIGIARLLLPEVASLNGYKPGEGMDGLEQ